MRSRFGLGSTWCCWRHQTGGSLLGTLMGFWASHSVCTLTTTLHVAEQLLAPLSWARQVSWQSLRFANPQLWRQRLVAGSFPSSQLGFLPSPAVCQRGYSAQIRQTSDGECRWAVPRTNLCPAKMFYVFDSKFLCELPTCNAPIIDSVMKRYRPSRAALRDSGRCSSLCRYALEFG